MLRASVIIAALVAVLTTASAALADSPFDPLGFRFSAPTYAVHENDGRAVITIVRSDTLLDAHANLHRGSAWAMLAES